MKHTNKETQPNHVKPSVPVLEPDILEKKQIYKLTMHCNVSMYKLFTLFDNEIQYKGFRVRKGI